MRGDILLLPPYVFMAWTGKILLLLKFSQSIFESRYYQFFIH